MYAHRDRPQDAISLYSSGGNTFDVRLSGDGSIDHQPIGRDRAYRDYHEGATVLHQGEQYRSSNSERTSHSRTSRSKKPM